MCIVFTKCCVQTFCKTLLYIGCISDLITFNTLLGKPFWPQSRVILHCKTHTHTWNRSFKKQYLLLLRAMYSDIFYTSLFYSILYYSILPFSSAFQKMLTRPNESISQPTNKCPLRIWELRPGGQSCSAALTEPGAYNENQVLVMRTLSLQGKVWLCIRFAT